MSSSTDEFDQRTSYPAEDVLQDYLGCALVNSVKESKTEWFQQLLKANADVNHYCYDCDDETSISIATRQGNLEFVKTLLELKADPNPSNDEPTPLMVSIYNNRPDISKLLLQYITDHENTNALAEACKLNNFELVKLLIECKANIDGIYCGTYRKFYETNPLIFACQYSNIEIIQLLIESGANVNPTYRKQYEKDYHTMGPLKTAMTYDRQDVVELLQGNNALETYDYSENSDLSDDLSWQVSKLPQLPFAFEELDNDK